MEEYSTELDQGDIFGHAPCVSAFGWEYFYVALILGQNYLYLNLQLQTFLFVAVLVLELHIY
jgi:hypothetical protein